MLNISTRRFLLYGITAVVLILVGVFGALSGWLDKDYLQIAICSKISGIGYGLLIGYSLLSH
jgi:hypothetical protein